jgi:trk system potassium uptake protein TrkA
MDATNQLALRSLPLSDIDCTVVAIGQSMDHSLRTVAALKQMNIGTIYARALDSTHKSILEAMNVSKIFIPESYAAKLFADKFTYNSTE